MMSETLSTQYCKVFTRQQNENSRSCLIVSLCFSQDAAAPEKCIPKNIFKKGEGLLKTFFMNS